VYGSRENSVVDPRPSRGASVRLLTVRRAQGRGRRGLAAGPGSHAPARAATRGAPGACKAASWPARPKARGTASFAPSSRLSPCQKRSRTHRRRPIFPASPLSSVVRSPNPAFRAKPPSPLHSCYSPSPPSMPPHRRLAARPRRHRTPAAPAAGPGPARRRRPARPALTRSPPCDPWARSEGDRDASSGHQFRPPVRYRPHKDHIAAICFFLGCFT
jgi:hypothetical protein